MDEEDGEEANTSIPCGFEMDEEDGEEANTDFDNDLESISTRGGSADSDSDEEAPKAANVEDSDEDDSSICTFTTARLNAANVVGGFGNTKIKTENLSSYATVKIENSDGTKDGEAQETSPAGPTASVENSVPGVVVKEDATKIFTKNIQTNGAYSAREESLRREVVVVAGFDGTMNGAVGSTNSKISNDVSLSSIFLSLN